MEEKVILMLEQYINVLTGVKDIKVEIIDDTVVLSREGRWHIYLIPGRFTMIGCFVDEDIEIADILKKNEGSIRYIYDNRTVESETL